MLTVGRMTVVLSIPIKGADPAVVEAFKDVVKEFAEIEAVRVVKVTVMVLDPVVTTEIIVAGTSGWPSDDCVATGLEADVLPLTEMPN